MQKYLLILFSIIILSTSSINAQIKLGADKLDQLLPLLQDKKIALCVNQTSCLSNGTHLVDTLLSSGINIKKIFAPEHGFRGTADAGTKIHNETDKKTGLPIISLYGKNYKPTKEQLKDVDVLIFDIQDVGARFYTYISTLHYLMQSCAENSIPLYVLDRPNPNDKIDGPVLETKNASFVGKHQIPILHGLTMGELAQMINGENWLGNNLKCDLTILSMDGWIHGQAYSLPVKPSPNLPNDQAIKLYPSLCFFEATKMSVGRGTYFPFQVIGFPDAKYGKFTFKPTALKGFDSNPLQKEKLCYGIDLRNTPTDGSLTLEYLIRFYKKSGLGSKFFSSPQFMDMLSGTDKLRKQIMEGKSEKEIRKTWEKDLKKYRELRKKYLIYNDNRY